LKQHKKGDRGSIKKRIVLKREQGNKEIIQSVRGEMARLECSIAFMHFALIHFCTYAFLHLCILYLCNLAYLHLKQQKQESEVGSREEKF
jgi:hypothetical protein